MSFKFTTFLNRVRFLESEIEFVSVGIAFLVIPYKFFQDFTTFESDKVYRKH
jgi:hypothetical protein